MAAETHSSQSDPGRGNAVHDAPARLRSAAAHQNRALLRSVSASASIHVGRKVTTVPNPRATSRQ